MTSPLVTAYQVTDEHAVRYRTAYSAQTALAHARRALDEGRRAAAEVWLKRAMTRSAVNTATLCQARRGLAALYLRVGRGKSALLVLAGARCKTHRGALLHLRGRAEHALGRFEPAEAFLQRALQKMWGRRGMDRTRARLLLDVAVCWDDMGQSRRAEMGLRTAVRALERTGQPRIQAAALLELGLLVGAREQAEGLAFVERALFLSEQHGDVALTHDALLVLAGAHERRRAHRSALLLRLRAASLLDPRTMGKKL